MCVCQVCQISCRTLSIGGSTLTWLFSVYSLVSLAYSSDKWARCFIILEMTSKSAGGLGIDMVKLVDLLFILKGNTVKTFDK